MNRVSHLYVLFCAVCNAFNRNLLISFVSSGYFLAAHEELRRAYVSRGELVETVRLPVCADFMSPRVRL